ncbi:hypothetical protein ZWY2020_041116 [Hordeum vulgare]|nr:hypothetical protein ZWY2020_041116 [Hordeum vulgare]
MLEWSTDPFHGNLMLMGFLKEGQLDKAYQIFKRMPVKDLVSWNSMIAGDVTIEQIACQGSGDYALLSNIYSSINRWDDSEEVWKEMKKKKEKVSGGKTHCPATILVFDIETTGFSLNSTFQTLINPEREVKNAAVHGISTNMVCSSDIPRFGEFIPILLQYVWSRQVAGKPVMWVAHNGKTFDVPFLIFEFQRCKQEMPGDWLFVDTLPIAKQLVDSNGKKISSASMKNLVEHYKIPVDGKAHRAMRDVTALCYVLQKLTFELKLTVPQLLEKSFRVSDIQTTPPKK